jgi:hypothetical protein
MPNRDDLVKRGLISPSNGNDADANLNRVIEMLKQCERERFYGFTQIKWYGGKPVVIEKTQQFRLDKSSQNLTNGSSENDEFLHK